MSTSSKKELSTVQREYLEKYIEILRTTEFQKTNYLLSSPEGDSFCAVGLLLHSSNGNKTPLEGRASLFLSEDIFIFNLIGVPSADLVTMNDLHGLSFKEIADRLEKERLN